MRSPPQSPPVAMQDGDAPAGEVDAVAAAREWLLAKGDFSSATWGTGGCSLGEGKDDVAVPFSAVAAMAEAICQLQASDQSGTRLIFAEVRVPCVKLSLFVSLPSHWLTSSTRHPPTPVCRRSKCALRVGVAHLL